ncbi:MAG: Ig-like domain-containing protein [Actinomycetota bacterium]|nr:Ig-like domain-containing protein [Actinomycetota bacterium]
MGAVAPADGTTGVARNAGLGVSFSEPMNRAATADAFSLARATDGARVSGAFSWSGNTLTFKPAAPLDPATSTQRGCRQTPATPRATRSPSMRRGRFARSRP